jgi:hypothetical protein
MMLWSLLRGDDHESPITVRAPAYAGAVPATNIRTENAIKREACVDMNTPSCETRVAHPRGVSGAIAAVHMPPGPKRRG